MQKSAQEKTVELCDQKCLTKMNEVATSRLKLAPYDLDTMSCPGLAKYVSVIFPNTDWSQVSMKPVLSTFIRRLDKTLVKIHKNQRIYVSTDWAAVSTLLRGLYQVSSHMFYREGNKCIFSIIRLFGSTPM